MKKIFLWLIVILFLVIMVIFMIMAVKGRGTENPTGSLSVPISSNDWIMGSTTSSVQIVEYSDFECPACAYYFNIVDEFMEKEGSTTVAFVYRHFPLSQHRNAINASMASEAAGRQGKFWEMYREIFKNQRDWASLQDARGTFSVYAKDIGLDMIRFERDVKDSVLRNKILEHYRSGVSSKITYTPTFFINGQKINNPKSYEELVSIVASSTRP